ncbi:helix-hairpin-helix domain-containing protein [Myxococcota bacterium]|nr:helix-hairpin-helix domain-containing protein [Myxococcota bacterium]
MKRILLSVVIALVLSLNAGSVLAQDLLNINTASISQLIRLPGVGPKRARSIVHYRIKKPFKRAIDLIRVKGIGKGIFRKLRPYITVISIDEKRGGLR